MKITRREMDQVTVLSLEGDLDDGGVVVLRRELLQCIKDRRVQVVLNLGRVGLVSYMSLGVLVERHRQMRLCGGDLKLVGVNVYAQRLFRMVGISTLFDVFDDEALAIDAYAKREAA